MEKLNISSAMQVFSKEKLLLFRIFTIEQIILEQSISMEFSNNVTAFWTLENFSSGITLINAQRTMRRNNRQDIPQ